MSEAVILWSAASLLCLLLFRSRNRILESDIFGSVAVVAAVLVGIPWVVFLLAALVEYFASGSEAPMFILIPFFAYQVPVAVLFGDSWFGDWFLPRDWRTVALLISFYLALSFVVAGGLRMVARRKATHSRCKACPRR